MFEYANASGLSPAGRRRRDTMLGDLLRTMGAVHRRRRRRRRARATGALIALAVALTAAVPAFRLPRVPGPPPRAAAPRVTVEFVVSDPTILDRCAIPPSMARRTTILDDEALVTALAAIDRPSGLVRTGGRVWLTNDVLGP